MPTKERYIQIMNELLAYVGGDRTTFSRNIGVDNPQWIADVLNPAKKVGISKAKISKICEAYPEINASYLTTGEGEMLKEEREGEMGHENFEDATPANVIPLLPVEAVAGSLQHWATGVELADCRKVVSPIPGADYAIQVSGNSMEPEIHDGTYIYIKKINEKSFIPWGNTMVVDTENGVVVKKLYPGTIESVLAKSVNPDYPPFEIPTESIFGIYRVLGGSFVVSTL